MGYFGSYSSADVSTSNPAQNADIDSVQMGGFLQAHDGLHYFLAAFPGGFDNYVTRRRVNIGSLNSTAQADSDGGQVAVYLEGGA